ncbi:MAG: PepSY-like domain-containing protein [Flavitalea sp.]
MKRLFSLVFALVITLTVSAQFRDIPGAVTNAFKEKYPTATNASWDDRISSFQAKFKMDGATYEARFDKIGTWIETEKEIRFDDVSEGVKSAHRASKFSDYTIRGVAEIEKANGAKEIRLHLRESAIKRKYVYYTPDGKFLRDDTKI